MSTSHEVGERQTMAWVALGSNLGPGEELIDAAITALAACSSEPTSLHCASLWRSEPVGCPPGSPEFLNTVVSFTWPWSGQRLLRVARAIETALGRRRGIRNGPRTIDLDLLIVGDERHDTLELGLPHPRLHQRRFVLEPLAELSPDLLLADGRSVEQTRAELAQQEPEGIWLCEPVGGDGWGRVSGQHAAF